MQFLTFFKKVKKFQPNVIKKKVVYRKNTMRIL